MRECQNYICAYCVLERIKYVAFSLEQRRVLFCYEQASIGIIVNMRSYLLACVTHSIKWNYKLTHTVFEENVVEGWEVSDQTYIALM